MFIFNAVCELLRLTFAMGLNVKKYKLETYIKKKEKSELNHR